MSSLNCSVICSRVVEGISTEPSACRSQDVQKLRVFWRTREVLKHVSLYCTEVFDFSAILAIYFLFNKSKEYY